MRTRDLGGRESTESFTAAVAAEVSLVALGNQPAGTVPAPAPGQGPRSSARELTALETRGLRAMNR